MAQFYLDRDAKSELGFSSTPVTVNGTAGNADRILLRGNAANVTVGAAVEIVDFYGASSDYAFVNEGGRVAVYRGDILVASVASNDKGTELRFSDGGLVMAQDPDTGALAIGGQQITNEKAAYAGDEKLTGREHQSEAGGGVGPQPGPTPGGEGVDYTLPGDLGDGNVISSGTGNDTYTGTLNKDSQIIDASASDNDTLKLSYSRTNENGAIVNVENIEATWTAYNGKAVFDAENVQHVNGTNITVNSAREGVTDALVNMAQNHHVIAGDNITGELTVGDADAGARVTMNNASALVIQTEMSSLSKEAITVNAEKGFSLALKDASSSTPKKGLPDYFQKNATDTGLKDDGSGTNNVAASISSDRAEKAILVNADKDLTITLAGSLLQGPTDTVAGNNNVAANIISVGSGKVTADIGTVGDLNISGLQVGTVKMKGAGTNNTLVVDRGQHLTLSKEHTGTLTFTMQTYTDDDASVRNMKVDNTGKSHADGGTDVDDLIGNTNAYALTVDLTAGNNYGTFNIQDGNIGTLNLVINGDTTVAEVQGTGELAKSTRHPVRLADAFVFSGKGNVTVQSMSGDGAGDGGVTVAAADGFKGLLTVEDAGNGTIVGGDGGTLVKAASVSNGAKLAQLGGTGVDTMEIGTVTVSGAAAAGTVPAKASTLLFDGGAGNDKVDLKGTLTVNGTDAKDTATFSMGAGDDVITFFTGTPFATTTANAAIAIDFGAGEADTLVVKASTNLSTLVGSLSIRNMDVLDLSDPSNPTLMVKQNQIASYDFQLKGAGKNTTNLVVNLNGTDDLDLSGLKVSDTAASHMVVQNVEDNSTASSAVITLDKVGIQTTINLQAGTGVDADHANGTADKHLVIDGFKGHEDQITITTAADTIVATTFADTTFSTSGFSAVDSEWKTLDDVLNGLAGGTHQAGATKSDLLGFKFEGSTYFMFLQSTSADAFGVADTVIQLVGDGYEKTDFTGDATFMFTTHP